MGGLGFWGPTYPIDVIKSSIQADSPDPRYKRYKGFFDCARQIHAHSGWRGFYKGLTPCLVRAAPAYAASVTRSAHLLLLISSDDSNAFAWAGYEYTIRAFERAGL